MASQVKKISVQIQERLIEIKKEMEASKQKEQIN